MKRAPLRIAAAPLVVALSACATHRRPVPAVVVPAGTVQEGIASWYGPGYDGKLTSSGERFDQDALTAAHHDWAFGTRLRVTLLSTGKSVVVTVNDRLPRRDRIIDLSRGAARAIGLIGPGTGRVRLEVVEVGRAPSSTRRTPAREEPPPAAPPLPPAPPPVQASEPPPGEAPAAAAPEGSSAGGSPAPLATVFLVLPGGGSARCEAGSGAPPRVTCTPGDTGAPLSVPFSKGASGLPPLIGLAAMETPGLPSPLVLAVARTAGPGGIGEVALLGVARGDLRDLYPAHFTVDAAGAVCVGALGFGAPPGVAVWRRAPGEGAPAAARKFEVTTYRWSGSAFEASPPRTSLRRYERWETASWELGFSCTDVLSSLPAWPAPR